MDFSPGMIQDNVARILAEPAAFGMERHAHHIYLDRVAEARFHLARGFQIINDEMRLNPKHSAATFQMPCMVTALAHSSCVDRVQDEAHFTYLNDIGRRFGMMSEVGLPRFERHFPAGGGVIDARTIAEVTVSHAVDEAIRSALYAGNPCSGILYSFDIQTHVGRLDSDKATSFGMTRESAYRGQRAACGAVMAALNHADLSNADHSRILSSLGEENVRTLRRGVIAETGEDITAAVASALLAVRGLEASLPAFAAEMDTHGVAHLTASMVVNRRTRDDTVILLGEGIIFNGRTHSRGFGADASKFSGRVVEHHGDKRMLLTYYGEAPEGFGVRESDYKVHQGAGH